MNRIETILMACVGDYEKPFNSRKPFRIGDRVYATNGRIAVRTRESVSIEVSAESEEFRAVADAGWDLQADVVGLPVLPDAPKKPPLKACGECGGSGEVECEYGHEHECPDCRGTGERIEGTSMMSVIVGGVPFDPRYLLMISAIGAAEVRVVAPQKPLLFAASGIEGLLMPLSEMCERHYTGTEVAKLREFVDALAAAPAGVSR